MSEATTYSNTATTTLTLDGMKSAMRAAMVIRAEFARLPEWIELPPSTERALEAHPDVASRKLTMPPDAFGVPLLGLRIERDYLMPPMSWRECWQNGRRVMHYASGLVVESDAK